MKKNKNIPWAKLFIKYNSTIIVFLSAILACWDLLLAKSFALGAGSVLLPTMLHAIITFNHSQTTSPAKMLRLFLLGAALKFIFVTAFVLLVLSFFVINTTVFFIGICFSIALYMSCSFARINSNISYAQ